MFIRRHPYLFFMLILAAMATVGMAAVAVMVASLSSDGIDISGEKVGVVEIAGAIADSRPVVEQIKSFRENEDIKAIVIRIDSPGGGVGPSQEIYREIRKTTAHKKVIASMGAVAASGGYYVAAGTDGIVANPGTITGSIGVIMGYTNFKNLLEKIGLVPVVIKSGDYKDIGSPVRDMTESERQLLQQLTHQIHRQFVAAIAEGRQMEPDKVSTIADGRVFTGEQALAMGLVDRLGNFEDAVQWAGQLGGIKGKVRTVYAPEEQASLLRYLFGAAVRRIGLTRWPGDWRPEFRFKPAVD